MPTRTRNASSYSFIHSQFAPALAALRAAAEAAPEILVDETARREGLLAWQFDHPTAQRLRGQYYNWLRLAARQPDYQYHDTAVWARDALVLLLRAERDINSAHRNNIPTSTAPRNLRSWLIFTSRKVHASLPELDRFHAELTEWRLGLRHEPPAGMSPSVAEALRRLAHRQIGAGTGSDTQPPDVVASPDEP